MENISVSKSKNLLRAEGLALVGAAKGLSYGTRRAVRSRVRVLATAVSCHFRLSSFADLTTEKICAIADDLAEARSIATMQNVLTTLREWLRAAGRADLADALSNASLGCDGRCRDGSHVPLSDGEAQHFVAEAAQLDTGVALAIELALCLGLRPLEALTSPKSLPSWRRKLNANARFLDVVFGVKTGRARDVCVQNIDQARDLIVRAGEYANANRGWLVTGDTREAALGRFYRVARAIGMVGAKAPHCCRYTFAHRQFDAYCASGDSLKLALERLSLDLGHNSGRFRWIRQVYLQHHPLIVAARGKRL